MQLQPLLPPTTCVDVVTIDDDNDLNVYNIFSLYSAPISVQYLFFCTVQN